MVMVEIPERRLLGELEALRNRSDSYAAGAKHCLLWLLHVSMTAPSDSPQEIIDGCVNSVNAG